MESRNLQNGIPVERELGEDILGIPFTQEMFVDGFNKHPFVNELARIKHSMARLEQKHGEKKSKLRPQYEQEMENIKRRYELYHKIEDAAFNKEKELLQILRQKVESGVSVEKEFGVPFGQEMEASVSHVGLMPGQVSSSILGPASRGQVEGHATGSMLGPIRQLDGGSILGPASEI